MNKNFTNLTRAIDSRFSNFPIFVLKSGPIRPARMLIFPTNYRIIQMPKVTKHRFLFDCARKFIMIAFSISILWFLLLQDLCKCCQSH